MSKGMTDIEKNMALAVLDPEIPLNEGFEKSFMESIKNAFDKGWSLSIGQHTTLESLYDKKILGNQEERTRFEFGLMVIQKNENNNYWKLWINGIETEEQMKRGDALVIANWLNDHLADFCVDCKIEPGLLDVFIQYKDNEDTENITVKIDDSEPDPF